MSNGNVFLGISEIKSQLSEKENMMFGQLGILKIDLQVGQLYQLAVNRAFSENLQGPAVDSLRRCFKALADPAMYRGTPEWDALISL